MKSESDFSFAMASKPFCKLWIFYRFENLENYEIQFAKGCIFLKEDHLIYENTCSDLYIIYYILYITTRVVTYISDLISYIYQNTCSDL